MWQVRKGLHHFPQGGLVALIDGYGEDDGQGKAEQQLSYAVHQGVSQEFDKIVGTGKGLEVLQTDPFAAKHTIEGHILLKGNLPIENGDVLEDDVIGQGKQQKKVYRSMAPDIPC